MKQNFKSLNNTLHNIIQKYNLDEAYADQIIRENWNKIVNKNVNNVVKPVKITNQVLHLHAKTDSWKQESEIVKDQIMEIVNKYLDPYQIKDIKFI